MAKQSAHYNYIAIGYTVTDASIDANGKQETYLANDIAQAVSYCLYTHKLHNGLAHAGPTGRVVYCPSCGTFAIIADRKNRYND